MRMKSCAALMALAALVVCSSVQASDPPNFDFSGYAQIPGSVGGTLILRSVLVNNGVVPTPIPMDFTTKQHTLVASGTLTAGSPQPYTPATVDLYSDAISGGTAANYASPGTFTDGEHILSGVFDGPLSRSTFTSTLGSFIGKVNWTGGTRLGELSVTNGWPFGGGWSRRVSGIPAGYQEAWDGKVDFNAVGVELSPWGAIKNLFR